MDLKIHNNAWQHTQKHQNWYIVKLMHGIRTYRRPPHTTYYVSTFINIMLITDHMYNKFVWYTHIRIFLILYLLHIC